MFLADRAAEMPRDVENVPSDLRASTWTDTSELVSSTAVGRGREAKVAAAYRARLCASIHCGSHDRAPVKTAAALGKDIYE